ncbi:MAG TPA: 2Fe-2S iron-sulfur cluster binding domain-containing protein, partial [Sorangium sp.]|nr:2Fe-2S iron-sulfur cluster binding domain-containing protein [Sorangium sp.]
MTISSQTDQHSAPSPADEASHTVNFTLNGAARQLQVVKGETLLEALRERCGLSSMKDGCSPQGQCGCCV